LTNLVANAVKFTERGEVRLVELMGGALTVESSLGSGSTFRFELGLPVVETASEPQREPGRLAELRALIVDDNATNRRVMRGSLESGGCEMAEAANGSAAPETLRAAHRDARPFELAVTDLVMPDMDGFELVQAVRSEPTTASMPVIGDDVDQPRPFIGRQRFHPRPRLGNRSASSWPRTMQSIRKWPRPFSGDAGTMSPSWMMDARPSRWRRRAGSTSS